MNCETCFERWDEIIELILCPSLYCSEDDYWICPECKEVYKFTESED